MKRHRNDDVARPWVGCAEDDGIVSVPLELRDIADTCPPDVVERERRAAYTTTEMIRTVGRKVYTIRPASDPDDLEIAVKWKIIEWAANEFASRRAGAQRQADDTRRYTCAVCAEIVVPGLNAHGHVMSRTFADGSRLKVCGKCAIVCERLAVDRLGAEQLADGRTRAELAADALLERSTT